MPGTSPTEYIYVDIAIRLRPNDDENIYFSQEIFLFQYLLVNELNLLLSTRLNIIQGIFQLKIQNYEMNR